MNALALTGTSPTPNPDDPSEIAPAGLAAELPRPDRPPTDGRGFSDSRDRDDLVAQLAFRTSVLEAQAEAVNDGLLLVSPSGEILSYNRRFAQQWGFGDALLGKKSDDAALAEAVDQLVDPEAFLGRVRYLYDHPHERSTDELRFRDGRVLERFSAPVYGDDGTFYGRVWSFRDITEQRRIERSLARRANEQAALYGFTHRVHDAESLEDVYGAAVDAIVGALGCDRASLLLFDEAGVMSFVAWHGLSDGYRSAVNGHTPWRTDEAGAEPICVSDIESSDLDEPLKKVVLGEGIGAFAFIPLILGERLIGKFMVYYDASHDFTDDEVSLALTMARQIASGIGRRRSDEERAEAEAALRDADRRKDEFLATLAHELRNPLSPMQNALPLLEQKLAQGEDVSRFVDILSRQTSRLIRLVDDLMDVSRITRGNIELRREHIDLTEVVRRALDAASEQAGAASLVFDSELPDGPVTVDGDAVRLEQVVHNLLSNAVKYTEPGGRIRIRVVADVNDVVVRVTDTGIGIDRRFLPRVFDLFEQADRSLDRSQGGLGIGLTVAKQLVELHGGTIEAHSEGLGSGSEFILRVARVTGAPSDPARAPAHRVSTSQHAPAAARVRRVLIVDDNVDQTDVMAELVEQLGHDAIVAHQGHEVFALVADQRPDIVLLDIGLPGLSGYDVAARLRQDPANSRMLLIALTGYGQPSDRERSRRAGFDSHIVKPIEVAALRRMLESGAVP